MSDVTLGINESGGALKGRISDGILRQNVVLMSGFVAGPVIAGATNLENAVSITLVFSLITILTVFLCRIISRKIVYTLRIIIYAMAASLVYIPVIFLTERIMGQTAIQSAGIYLPILVVNPVILSKSETRFYLMPKKDMSIELLGYVLGFDIVCLSMGVLRDVLVNSRIGWLNLDVKITMPALETTFGGIILVGVMAGIARAMYNRFHRSDRTTNG